MLSKVKIYFNRTKSLVIRLELDLILSLIINYHILINVICTYFFYHVVSGIKRGRYSYVIV